MWLTGLQINENVHSLRKGSTSPIDIQVCNTTGHDITSPKRTLLGHVQLVKSVTPMEVKFKESNVGRDSQIGASVVTLESIPTSSKQQDSQLLEQEHTESESKSHKSKGHIREVDLGDLTPDQKGIVTKMLYEESESFSNDDFDSGCAKDLQMEIRLSDHTPVHSYPETKAYIEDLLNQGFVHPESRYLTALVTPWSLCEWVRILFGLISAPATFQRYMEECLGDMRYEFRFRYFSLAHKPNFADHVIITTRLQRMHFPRPGIILRWNLNL